MDQSLPFTGLSRLERWLFARTISFTLHQVARPESHASKQAARDGLASTGCNLIGRELVLIGMVVGWGRVVVEGAFARGWGTTIAAPVLASVFSLAAAVFSWGCLRIATASRWAKRFRYEAGVILKPSERVPTAPLPRGVGASLVGIFSLEILVLVALLLSTSYAAPQLTGGFFVATGLTLLGVSATMLLRRPHIPE
jgi:hypothetical protein